MPCGIHCLLEWSAVAQEDEGSPVAHSRKTHETPANDPFTKPKTEFHYPEFSSEKRSASVTELLSNRFKAFGKVAEIGIRGAA